MPPASPPGVANGEVCMEIMATRRASCICPVSPMLVNGASGRVRRPEPVVRQEALSTASCAVLGARARGPGTMAGLGSTGLGVHLDRSSDSRSSSSWPTSWLSERRCT